MSETNTPTASTTASPPSPSIDVNLPRPSLFWTRLFTWAVGTATLALWYSAIGKGSANVWPYCVVVCFLVFAYVIGARATDVVQLVQSSGIIRAAQAASTTLQAGADAATDVIHHVLPAPTTGGRSDLAS